MEDGEQKCKLRIAGVPESKRTKDNIQRYNEENIAESFKNYLSM